uniref:Reverse transcriptase RNase H-like domain-containing protein n=1 Tax=Amphimedon queenslandica TaxID=400682 RepID=A0A1X7UWL0_AMPQE
MVVALKKSGSVCICVEFRDLNESVLREVHPLPTVDETLAHLNGASVFRKLDATSGFWQIPLADTIYKPDASAIGLVAVLLQYSRDTWKPVAYASKFMSKTEQ